jgi:hypothetical protein
VADRARVGARAKGAASAARHPSRDPAVVAVDKVGRVKDGEGGQGGGEVVFLPRFVGFG